MNKKFPDALTMVRELISLPSVSCTDSSYDQSNLKVINCLADWLETLGFEIEIDNISEGKANLIARKGSGENGLLLSGHTDTVPCDLNLWNSDPFKLEERQGRLYGLGTADMKSFFALAIEAAKIYAVKDFKQPLTILATADEESSMSGARYLLESQKRLGRFAVIGEPTGMRPIRLHKGIMMESIRVYGKSAHSSDPRLGASAIEGMQVLLTELLAFQRELKQKYKNSMFDVDYPTLNLGSIHGGDNPNRICAHCETQIDIRPLPGMDIAELHQSLLDRLLPLLKESGLSVEIASLFEGLSAFETKADAEIVRVCEHLTQKKAGSVSFGTEAPFLAKLGLETLIMGPGDINQAHQPDEYIALDQIQPSIDILKKLIEKFCIGNPIHDA